VLGDICQHARIDFVIEPKHLLGQNKQRPDLLIHFGKDGHDISYDLTIVNPVRDEAAVKSTLRDEQGFLSTDEQAKIRKYQDACAEQGMSFCPLVLSAFGGVLRASYTMGLSPLIRKIRKSNFCSPNWAAPNRTTYWLQRIAIMLWAGNVAKVKPFLMQRPLRHI